MEGCPLAFFSLFFQGLFLSAKLGYSVNVPQNKMAYEVIMVYHLRMPFFIAIFLCFLKKSIRQDMTFRKKSDDLF